LRQYLYLLIIFLLFFEISSNAANNRSKDIEIHEILPAKFRKNVGQWDSSLFFQATFNGTELNFQKNSIFFTASRECESKSAEPLFISVNKKNREYLVWKLNFLGANKDVLVNGLQEQESHTNYLIGNDPRKHKLNVTDYGEINYNNIYDNIDLRYYANENQLEYDYILWPGAQINSIKMNCDGIEKIEINDKAELEITTAWGKVKEKTPYAYQIVNGIKKTVAVHYALLNKTTYGFKALEEYDKSKPLIIDPVILKWSTFVGGTNAGGSISDIAVDAAGNSYGLSSYTSLFPVTPGAFRTSGSGLVVFKLDPSGSNLIYATYVGGTGNDYGNTICVNAVGEVLVSGYTTSSDFPTTTACYDASYNTNTDLFLFKLNAGGSALQYSTYIGGSDYDGYAFMSLAQNGTAYIVATSLSANFPTTAGCAKASLSGLIDAVVFKLNPAGTGATDLVYSTFIGGTGIENGMGITINTAGETFISGSTTSANFPVTANAVTSVIHPGPEDAFVCRINPLGAGTADLVYATYLGGSGHESYNYSIAVNNNNEIFVSGITESINFPVTANAYNSTYNASAMPGDLYVTRINPSKAGIAGLIYSTYLGGNANEFQPFNSLRVGLHDNVWVAGYTNSNNFPVTTCAFNRQYNRGQPGIDDLFLCVLSTTSNNLYYSTFINSSGADMDPCMELYGDTCNTSVFIGLSTIGSDLPTTPGVFMTSKSNDATTYQLAIMKFTPEIHSGFISTSNSICGIENFTDTTNTCGLWQPLSKLSWSFGDGSTSTVNNPTHFYSASGTYNVKLAEGCPEDSITIPITVLGGTSVNISPASVTITAGTGTTLSATGGPATINYSWSPPIGLSCINCPDPVANPTSTTKYYVTTTNTDGCTAMDSVIVTVDLTQCGNVFVPTAFSPNADGINDVLNVKSNCIKTFSFKIYNRWGESVFETNDINRGWDGTFEGQLLNTGIFIYQLDISGLSGEHTFQKGNISLVR
jgi:gliding motility-associated-like protein